jgi:hypothetical protein
VLSVAKPHQCFSLFLPTIADPTDSIDRQEV